MRTDARTYRFDDFTLHPAERQLQRNGADITLRPKAFDTLVCLVRQHGHAVSKAELLDAVWPETNVSEAVLTHCIAEVRQALSDERGRPRFVKTMSRHGYKFIAPVEIGEAAEPADQSRETYATAAPLPAPSTIVVLPFTNMSADAGNEYFCDGLSEELINGLTRIGSLQVVAHSSSFSFKGRDIDAREIGRQLNAAMILEGSVRKDGDRLRVSAQLIDATRGYHLWCNQYDRRLEDVFAIQEEISQAILASLKLEFVNDGHAPLVRRSTANMDAYMLYLQGRTCWHNRYSGALEQAMDCFGQAIGKDPAFPLPYTGLADSLSTLGIWGFARPRDVFPKAAALAETAQALDDGLGEAHASRALIRLFWDWDWSGAERGFIRALDLNPGCALIRLWNGHYLSMVGRMDEAIAEVKRAQALDPLSPVCSANVGWTFYLAHDITRAIDELQRVLAREPQNAMALFYLGYAWLEVGRDAEAIDCLRRADDLTHGMPWAAEGIGLAHGLAGRRDEALAALRQADARSAAGCLPASALAIIHLGLGDDEKVLDALERGIDERDVLLPWLKFMPPFDRLHTHPRFQAVLGRLGL
ncbi:MAG: winged helix-turn-helix domain-containing tetratricopeptide repeat protein [Bacteroidales bacterium]